MNSLETSEARRAGEPAPAASWLNRTVLGTGLTSLFSDWSHETATAILPGFLATLGAGPGWLGAIEGVADGLSSVTKLVAGHFTDRLERRKPLVIFGYGVTTAATGALGLVNGAAQTLALRATAWLGRGMRTPGRKALMAADVPRAAYGRAFGFERMMDTLGAIAGPLTALWLLEQTQHNYRRVFLWTLLPGLLAVAAFWTLVRERPTTRSVHASFFSGLRALPTSFRGFLLAVGVFGMGDFSHTLLILYAARQLTPSLGAGKAASVAIGFYMLHNVSYSASAYAGGWLGDHLPKRKIVLAGGYTLAGATAILLCAGSRSPWLLGLILLLAGSYVGIEEALEDSLAAELVPRVQHGMGFGTLAAVNAVGDFVSSLFVGVLWSAFSAQAAFAAAAILFFAGAVLVARLR